MPNDELLEQYKNLFLSVIEAMPDDGSVEALDGNGGYFGVGSNAICDAIVAKAIVAELRASRELLAAADIVDVVGGRIAKRNDGKYNVYVDGDDETEYQEHSGGHDNILDAFAALDGRGNERRRKTNIHSLHG